MRRLGFCILLVGISGAISPAAAQRSNPGGGGSDPCANEADRLYSHMRNLDERMRVKRAHIVKCRAASGGRR